MNNYLFCPFDGTRLDAHGGRGRCPVCRFVDYGNPAPAVGFVSGLLLPSTRLEGAHAVSVPLGHSSLVVSDEVYAHLVHTLRREPEPSSRDVP